MTTEARGTFWWMHHTLTHGESWRCGWRTDKSGGWGYKRCSETKKWQLHPTCLYMNRSYHSQSAEYNAVHMRRWTARGCRWVWTVPCCKGADSVGCHENVMTTTGSQHDSVLCVQATHTNSYAYTLSVINDLDTHHWVVLWSCCCHHIFVTTHETAYAYRKCIFGGHDDTRSERVNN